MWIFGRLSFWLAALLVILVIAGAGVALRWRALTSIYNADQEPPPAITEQHVAALRLLRFTWDPLVESGGPIVDPAAPYGSRDMVDDLGPIIGTRDPLAVARLHMEVSAAFIAALKTAELSPGDYRLNHLDAAGMEADLRKRLKALPPERVAAIIAGLPRLGPNNMFHLTEEHIRLLRHIEFKLPEAAWYEVALSRAYPVPTVNFKRPFGDATDFDRDMASILGLPQPDTEQSYAVLDRLYWEMWPALQVFVENARLAAAAPKE